MTEDKTKEKIELEMYKEFEKLKSILLVLIAKSLTQQELADNLTILSERFKEYVEKKKREFDDKFQGGYSI